MGQVTVAIGGRDYALACRDGDEPHLTALAALIESKTGGLTASLGAMSEPRLLLMAGLLVADDLVELRKQHLASASQPAAMIGSSRIAAIAGRVEALAADLEHYSKGATERPTGDAA